MKKLFLLISLMFLPIISHAACVRADLTGTWIIYSSINDRVARCAVVIPSSGTALSSSSNCAIPNIGSYKLSGNVSLDGPTCRVYGNINVGGLAEAVDTRISRGKDSISGMSWPSGHPENGGVWSGVKQ